MLDQRNSRELAELLMQRYGNLRDAADAAHVREHTVRGWLKARHVMTQAGRARVLYALQCGPRDLSAERAHETRIRTYQRRAAKGLSIWGDK